MFKKIKIMSLHQKEFTKLLEIIDRKLEIIDYENESKQDFVEPFYFIHAADTQFGLIDRYLKKLDKPGWDEEKELSEMLVLACNTIEPKPKFIIICGDLIDAYPHLGELKRMQINDLKKIFSKLNIPLVCVCGNHDIGNEPTMGALIEYKNDFGPDYFYFIQNGILFIVLNSQFYEHREYVEDYAKEQDDWLEKILKQCKHFKYSIVFQHIPWFLKDPNEDKDYFNIAKETRLKWLSKFKEAGVTKVLCGHYHKNGGGWFEDIELVITSAVGAQLGEDESGVRIVKILKEGIEHEYYPMPKIPNNVSLVSGKESNS